MGSQYIKGTTYLKTRHKKIKEVSQIGFLGHLPVFYDDLWGIYKRDRQVFHRIFHIFHNGVSG